VSSVNDAPSGSNKTVTTKEDVAYALKAADFGFSDVDGNTLAAVRISSLPGAGKLTNNGAALGVGALVSIADINSGKLKFTPAKDANGLNHASFTFQVKDNGSGGNLDPTPNKITINVTAVLDVFTGTAAPDNFTGTNDRDLFKGLGGNDRISGLAGDDDIFGGVGGDRLTGGLGKDNFILTTIGDSAAGQSGLVNGLFNQAQGSGLRDIIADFTAGQDDIDLSAIDASTKVAGNQAFSWRGTGNFTGVAGQLIERIYNNAGTASDRTIVYSDINGDAKADFQVELTGLKTLAAGDFVL
jgi:Ca2+-binding RTX toxin-like protein